MPPLISNPATAQFEPPAEPPRSDIRPVDSPGRYEGSRERSTDQERRQALRAELAAAFGSGMSLKARVWLHSVCPYAAERAGVDLPLVALLDAEEVDRARAGLALRRNGGR
jgi:hypothetical protein